MHNLKAKKILCIVLIVFLIEVKKTSCSIEFNILCNNTQLVREGYDTMNTYCKSGDKTFLKKKSPQNNFVGYRTSDNPEGREEINLSTFFDEIANQPDMTFIREELIGKNRQIEDLERYIDILQMCISSNKEKENKNKEVKKPTQTNDNQCATNSTEKQPNIEPLPTQQNISIKSNEDIPVQPTIKVKSTPSSIINPTAQPNKNSPFPQSSTTSKKSQSTVKIKSTPTIKPETMATSNANDTSGQSLQSLAKARADARAKAKARANAKAKADAKARAKARAKADARARAYGMLDIESEEYESSNEYNPTSQSSTIGREPQPIVKSESTSNIKPEPTSSSNTNNAFGQLPKTPAESKFTSNTKPEATTSPNANGTSDQSHQSPVEPESTSDVKPEPIESSNANDTISKPSIADNPPQPTEKTVFISNTKPESKESPNANDPSDQLPQPLAKARANDKAKARANAKAKAKADSIARTEARAEARAKTKADAKANAKARADARAKAKADAKAKAKAEARDHGITYIELEATPSSNANGTSGQSHQSPAEPEPTSNTEPAGISLHKQIVQLAKNFNPLFRLL
ncbi:hypothetical protein NEFER03_0879 [Nematocida sp. LUAm3]|nr:hypothetical protein NEFER03_0879 [Nematocida sp. LUAm3]KAI5174897.1 hypothetical protein NEFER02_0997 [Nematocida sp. LUAm2]KAI5177505.1 hypothetical protein NEFER01_0755 [Nematocida sp. LUAm1]